MFFEIFSLRKGDRKDDGILKTKPIFARHSRLANIAKYRSQPELFTSSQNRVGGREYYAVLQILRAEIAFVELPKVT